MPSRSRTRSTDFAAAKACEYRRRGSETRVRRPGTSTIAIPTLPQYSESCLELRLRRGPDDRRKDPSVPDGHRRVHATRRFGSSVRVGLNFGRCCARAQTVGRTARQTDCDREERQRSRVHSKESPGPGLTKREASGPSFIEPGSPWQNGHNESFNAVFRDSCLEPLAI